MRSIRLLPPALALALLGVVVPGATAAPCTTPYPASRIGINGPAYVTYGTPGGDAATVFRGHLSWNGCPVSGVRIGLYKRTGSTGFVYQAQRVSSSDGGYQFLATTYAPSDYFVSFSGDSTYPRATSQLWHVAIDYRPKPMNPCQSRLLPNTGYSSPANITLLLRLFNNQVWRGNDLQGALRVTNGTSSSFLFDERWSVERWTTVLDLRNGEIPGQGRYSISSQHPYDVTRHIVAAGASIEVPVTIHTRICEGQFVGPAIKTGDYVAIGNLEIAVSRPDHQRVWERWYAAPVQITVN